MRKPETTPYILSTEISAYRTVHRSIGRYRRAKERWRVGSRAGETQKMKEQHQS
jgi:hypothetical protein